MRNSVGDDLSISPDEIRVDSDEIEHEPVNESEKVKRSFEFRVIRSYFSQARAISSSETYAVNISPTNIV